MLELNQIYNEDCLGERGMCLIPDKSVDMILADLPYAVTQNSWDSMLPLGDLWQEYKRLIKPNGAIVLTALEPFSSILVTSNLSMFKYKWIWDKRNATGFLNVHKQPLRRTEDVLVFYERQCTYNPHMQRHGKARKKGQSIKGDGSSNYGSYGSSNSFNNEFFPTTLLSISHGDRSTIVHPTQKPVALFEYLIRTYTNEGETVLDNTMGSGTTAVACIATRRNFIGFELDPEYHRIANERIANVQSALFV